MSQLDELRFAYEQSTPGEWDICRHATPDYHPQHGVYAEGAVNDLAIVFREADGDFICAAKSLAPPLLEAVDLLETVSSARACQDHEFDTDAWFKQVRRILKDLK